MTETRHPLVIAGAIKAQIELLGLVAKNEWIENRVRRIDELVVELQGAVTERELKASLELKREGR